MKKNVKAHIECNGSGFYSIYVEHGDLPFNFFGDGETEQAAREDFMAVYEAMREDYKERTGVDVQAEFSFVKDMSTVNMLKISKLRMGGGKFAARILLIALLIGIFVFAFLQGFRSVTKPAVTSTEVEVKASLFFDRDSVNYYAERAYLLDDPQGQFVVGACYYLRQQGELPEEIYAVSHDEADDFLIRSALQGYQPALNLIHCLHANGCWHHPLPETK